MTNDRDDNDSQAQDEWALYLQVFLDESDEDLESLVQVLLRLEHAPHDAESLNEAFRLLHTHKGSAGLMGFDGISALAHELESRFDQFRSGNATLDRVQITVLLRCVDFLRRFNAALRTGQTPDQDATEVLRQLAEIEQPTDTAMSDDELEATTFPVAMPSLQGGYRVRIEFEAGLQLADMKARLIVARVSNVGEIIATEPPVEDMQSIHDLSIFELIVVTDHDPEEVRRIADVDGVKSVRIEGGDPTRAAHVRPVQQEPSTVAKSQGIESTDGGRTSAPDADEDAETSNQAEVAPTTETTLGQTETLRGPSASEPQHLSPATASTEPYSIESPLAEARVTQSERTAVAETVRVGIDRLDNLMNLTGELVVTEARLVQITSEMKSVFRAGKISNRTSEMSERLRAGLGKIKELLVTHAGSGSAVPELLDDLGDEIDAVEEHLEEWEEGRRHFVRIGEAVDQLSGVSGNLQQSVLATRMVPVAPLFNRFKRVIRDLAGERNKQVQLVIRGETTELDKRMIDELGDPLLHLIRNSLDHGLEMPDERRRLGKPEIGTIALDASHSGNNVFITIHDDGAGLNLERIQERVLERGLASENAVAEMNEQQIISHIWHPGFSTAAHVTDISGRGVGMDVVKNRISELNGSIQVETKRREGTSFTLRLPLTLAIIRCLLVRFRAGFFSLPIADVREIVAVSGEHIHSIHGCETIDVRGEFIPLIRMDRVFYWNDRQDPEWCASGRSNQGPADIVNVVVLHTAGRTIGMCVDELFGSADIVIKSLSDNFIDIRGLSGASIMGDGMVCLMLDTSEIIKMAAERPGDARPSLAM